MRRTCGTPPGRIVLRVAGASLVAAGILPTAAAAGGTSGAAGQGGAPVTFNRDVAPILDANCVGCHRPGGIGPFSLTTYDEVRERAARIAAATSERRMPPWKPVPDHRRFRNERRLADAEIALLAGWAAAGAPEGDPADHPAPPATGDGWQLGTPDRVVTMATPFRLPAGGTDVYRNFVLPAALDEPPLVRAPARPPGRGPGRRGPARPPAAPMSTALSCCRRRSTNAAGCAPSSCGRARPAGA